MRPAEAAGWGSGTGLAAAEIADIVTKSVRMASLRADQSPPPGWCAVVFDADIVLDEVEDEDAAAMPTFCS